MSIGPLPLPPAIKRKASAETNIPVNNPNVAVNINKVFELRHEALAEVAIVPLKKYTV
jgi:hypothetical protein